MSHSSSMHAIYLMLANSTLQCAIDMFMCVTDSQSLNRNKKHPKSTAQTEVNSNFLPLNNGNYDKPRNLAEEMYKNITGISFASVSSDQHTVLSEIEAAEMLGNCVIDFQI